MCVWTLYNLLEDCQAYLRKVSQNYLSSLAKMLGSKDYFNPWSNVEADRSTDVCDWT